MTRRFKLSHYIKYDEDDGVAIHLNCDPKKKTYEVILIIDFLYHARNKKFFFFDL